MYNKMKYLCIFFVLLFIQSPVFAQNITLNYPLSDSLINGTIVLNTTTDYENDNATFYYSNTTNFWDYEIDTNTTNGTEFTLSFDTRSLSDGIYNFTVNATNSTHEIFDTSTNVTVDNPPKWSNNITSIDSGSEYSPNQVYQFNITWEDNSLNQIFFESNYTLNASEAGNLTNYSYPNVTNSSVIFWINLTDLPAQTFIYRWIANDSLGNSNSTENLTYVIDKNSSVYITLTLDGDEANKTYNLNQNATFTANLDIPNKTIYLNSDCPCWTNLTNTTSFASNTTNLASLGFYSVNAYWDGDNNYTNSSQTYFFSVTDLNWSNNKTSPNSSSTYTQERNYSFEINWTGSISTVIFESNFTGTMTNYTYNYSYFYDNDTKTTNMTEFNNIFNNSDSTYWINFTDLPAGNYNYTWYANDTNNIWISTRWNYIINSFSITPTFVPQDGSWTTTTSTLVTLVCTTPHPVNLTITPGGSLDDNYTTYTFTTLSTQGSTDYTCTVSGNSNYTGSNSGTLSYAPFTPNQPIDQGGPGDGQDTGQFTITPSNSKITVETGSSKVITFTLKNTLSSDITSIIITVSGISSDWYDLDKTTISKLQRIVGSETIRMTLNIPDDADTKTYQINVKASGKKLGVTDISKQTTVELTVSTPTPEEEEEETFEVVIAPQENITSNETEAGPTGFLPLVSEYFPYLVLLLGTVASILIFVKRDAITYTLMKTYGKKVPKKLKKKKTKAIKLPSFKDFTYKLSLNFKKTKRGRKPKTLEKPEKIEREIKRDIKELQNLLEAEKRLKKRKK